MYPSNLRQALKIRILHRIFSVIFKNGNDSGKFKLNLETIDNSSMYGQESMFHSESFINMDSYELRGIKLHSINLPVSLCDLLCSN